MAACASCGMTVPSLCTDMSPADNPHGAHSTIAMEQAERDLWLADAAAAGVVIGSTLAG